MSSSPQKANKNTQQHLPRLIDAGAAHEGDSVAGQRPILSAQAAAFVPSGFAQFESPAREVANGGRPLSSGRPRGGRKGHVDASDCARGSAGGRSEGGISRALRSTGRPARTSDKSPGAQGAVNGQRAAACGGSGGAGAAGEERPSLEPADDRGVAARGGEGALLGRSPQRGAFVPANHLLNFQYDTRAAGARGGSGAVRGRGGRRGAPRPQPYDRNKFLQANFRFLVSDAGDLRRWEGDADLMPDWEDVLEVEMLAPAPLRCPISLDAPPLCPQITPCGHVFAFPAIMAHLAAHNDGASVRRAAPCPLCYAPVVARELRLVRVHQASAPQVGNVLTFKLLRRPRRSIIPIEAEPDAAAAHQRPQKAGEPTGAAATAAWAAAANGIAGNAADGAQAGAALVYNRFAKFTAVADATPLWRGAAEALADYAAVVMAEGTLEAAMEAPHMFAASDALAARAAAWTERRQRLRIDAAPADGPELQDAHEAGAAAAAEVKKVTMAAVSAAAEQQSREAAAAARAADFPSLPHAGRPAERPGTGGAGGPAAHVQAARAQALEAAFSDEDDYFDLEADAPGASSARQPASPGAPEGAGAQAAAEPGAACSSGVPIAGAAIVARAREAAGSYPSDGEAALGSSPTEGGAGFAASGDFHFYQAEDGQWLFLGALEVRALLTAAGGAPAALPGAVAGRLVAVEPVVQTEAVRRRIKFLGHLPLNGTFHVAEIDLASLLPAKALAPFAEEVRSRERRRERRSQEEAKRAARDAAREAAALAASMGPTAAELRAMPLPSAAAAPGPPGDAADGGAAGAEPDGEAAGDAAAMQPTSGLSFANITKLGYAATGPALGTSPTASAASAPRAWGPSASARTPASPAVAAPAAWAALNPRPPGSGGSRSAPGSSPADAGAWCAAENSLAAQLSAAMAAHTAAAAAPDGGADGGGGGGKKGRRGSKQTLLFSTTQRRY